MPLATRSYRPSTTTMLMLEDLERMSLSAVYSGESIQAWACWRLPNSSMARRLGFQSPNMMSRIVPHTNVLDAIVHATMSHTCLHRLELCRTDSRGVDVDWFRRPQRLSIRLYLRAFPWPHHRDGPRLHAILSKERLREESEATTRRRGSAKTSTSTGASRGSPRPSIARCGSYEARACGLPAVASTAGRCGGPSSGPTISSSRCSAAGRRSGGAGTRMRCGRPPYPTGGGVRLSRR